MNNVEKTCLTKIISSFFGIASPLLTVEISSKNTTRNLSQACFQLGKNQNGVCLFLTLQDSQKLMKNATDAYCLYLSRSVK